MANFFSNLFAGARQAATEREIRHWLAKFAECGIRFNEPFTEADILCEISLYRNGVEPEDVLSQLGGCEEGEPWRPYSAQVFYLDTEYIDHDGAYAEIVERMAGMTGGALVVTNATSALDIPDGEAEGRAHISFDCNGQHIEIDIEQDSDWCDEMVLHCMAVLINASDSTKCIFAIPSDDQTITMACTERACLKQLQRGGLKAEAWEDRLPVKGMTVSPLAG